MLRFLQFILSIANMILITFVFVYTLFSNSIISTIDDNVPYNLDSMVFDLSLQLGDKRLLIDKKASKRWSLLKLISLRKSLIFILIITLWFMLYTSFHLSNTSFLEVRRNLPKIQFQCKITPSNESNDHNDFSYVNIASYGRLRLDPKILLLVETQYSSLGRMIAEVLEASRFKLVIEVLGKNLPKITNMDQGKFALIIFENYEKYLLMNKWNRDILDKYCRDFRVGIIGFMASLRYDTAKIYKMKGFPLNVYRNVRLVGYHLNPESPVFRLTRAGVIQEGTLSSPFSAVFTSNHSTYQPIGQAYLQTNKLLASTIILDRGHYDNIQRIIFGTAFNIWIHKLILLDAISYLSHGKLSLPLKRYILIDIDDIFIGKVRLTPSDVQAILDTQQRLKKLVPGFRFNLGFSGKFYQFGTSEENRGDEMLVQNAKEFWWFGHMWDHSKPHLYNLSVLNNEMANNKKFAQIHNLTTDLEYSVAPHHSGVFPVHEPLYEAWKNVWNVRVTSTEEYPHLKPFWARRGFIHRGIMVLPRQTCGLYTHTFEMKRFPGGKSKLDHNIRGGELFYSFVYNPINIFMTHMSNYARDRLALYAFEYALNFIKCYTHITLETLPPFELATKYFQTYPEERDPLWINPCKDRRHLAIWSPQKSCNKLPKFLIIGPQKTGSTALFTFLAMHPLIYQNHPSHETFEEIQFFNGKNYYKGLDWYMSFYPSLSSLRKDTFLFEKSSNYFDAELAPLRAYSLLPDAKIITILRNPAKRAYSWYHHVRAHGDVTALNYTFYDVITATNKSSKSLRDVHTRCLHPGFYAYHLEKWLKYYSPNKLAIVDADELRNNPVQVLDRLQTFLEIKSFFNYKSRLRYEPKKGFFCQVTDKNNTKCLGPGKGRKYAKMDKKSETFLREYYLSHNVALSKLLNRLHQPFPQWLQDELSLS